MTKKLEDENLIKGPTIFQSIHYSRQLWSIFWSHVFSANMDSACVCIHK